MKTLITNVINCAWALLNFLGQCAFIKFGKVLLTVS